MCGRPIERSGGPGAPPRYCDLPGHDRAKAFAARRSYAHASAGSETGAAGAGSGVELLERPVTDGRASFGALLAQFGEVAGQTQRVLEDQQAELRAILTRAQEVARTIADPEAAAYEVEQVQREAGVRIAEAHSAQAAAERETREARRRVEDETELRAQADVAAEEALRELEAVRAETAETIARITAETDAQVADAQRRAERADAAERAARSELERVRAEAADQVSATDRLRAELAQVRREATEERAALRQEARQQLAVLARLTTPEHREPAPTPTAPTTTSAPAGRRGGGPATVE